MKQKVEQTNYPVVPSEQSSNSIVPTPAKVTWTAVLHKQRSIHKFNILLLILILLFSGVSMWLVKANAISNKDLQTGIAEEVLRFHVIANSDSEADQSLKLAVKDELVSSMAPYLRESTNLAETKAIISKQLPNLKDIAEDIIMQNGYSYSITVALEECYFPLKIYGNYTFPPGYYQALRVKIGKAEGKNWWCVMFPPLCFVDETYSIIDEASKEKLLQLLTEEEYETLVSQKAPVKIKFKLVEMIKDLFK